jgi:hypothetical protein
MQMTVNRNMKVYRKKHGEAVRFLGRRNKADK